MSSSNCWPISITNVLSFSPVFHPLTISSLFRAQQSKGNPLPISSFSPLSHPLLSHFHQLSLKHQIIKISLTFTFPFSLLPYFNNLKERIMENFISMSCRERRMQPENHNNNRGKSGGPTTSMQDLGSYSTSYSSSYQVHPQPSSKESKPINGGNNYKKNRGGGSSSSLNSLKGWSLSDPELQRKKRIASYKVYDVEGKMKGSVRKSFRWIKNTCSQVVYGWW